MKGPILAIHIFTPITDQLGGLRREQVLVDADVVIIDIVELLIFEHIKFDAEQVIIAVVVDGMVDEVKLSRRGGAIDSAGRSKDEDGVMAGELVVVWSDGEDEGGVEGEDRGRVGGPCRCLRIVKCSTYGKGGCVCKDEQTGFECCSAVE
uniref:Uncharacterized protein n=1 Tax=Nelumbo nucifera TaxID=4432 RepID=A0A822XSN5_NELNU|nr:TPA_asm: hypothetical protein HUJ06_023288 [Nelumbo nucifera]